MARCLPEGLPLPEDGRLLPPLRRKESTSAATTGLVTGNLACGLMNCSEMPTGSCDGGGETPQPCPRSVFGIPCVGRPFQSGLHVNSAVDAFSNKLSMRAFTIL